MQFSLIDQETLIEKIHISKQDKKILPSKYSSDQKKPQEAVNNDDTKGNIEVEEQEMKFKNEDSVNNDDRIEGDRRKEKKKILNLRMKILSIPCYLFTKQNGNVVFLNVMVEKCYRWIHKTICFTFVLSCNQNQCYYQILGLLLLRMNKTRYKGSVD